MTNLQTTTTARYVPSPRPFHVITDRLHGPGGYYNVGNVLGLAAGLATQVMVSTSSIGTVGDRLYGFFLGSPGALALTVSTSIFLASGEAYHRAWAGRASPDPKTHSTADLLAAAGATALTVSLVLGGQLPLALASGVLMVGGKLGSAIAGDTVRIAGWPSRWSDPFRSAVLIGRLPGLTAAALDLGRHVLDAPTGMGLVSLVQPATLVICQALWLKADLLLLNPAAKPAGAPFPLGEARP